jgi:hypothetical protein
LSEIKTPKGKRPKRCICGRIPTVAKGRGCGWILACPDPITCKHNPTSGRWSTLAKAVEEWNNTIKELRRKEG